MLRQVSAKRVPPLLNFEKYSLIQVTVQNELGEAALVLVEYSSEPRNRTNAF